MQTRNLGDKEHDYMFFNQARADRGLLMNQEDTNPFKWGIFIKKNLFDAKINDKWMNMLLFPSNKSCGDGPRWSVEAVSAFLGHNRSNCRGNKDWKDAVKKFIDPYNLTLQICFNFSFHLFNNLLHGGLRLILIISQK